jgi:hypothetical protein
MYLKRKENEMKIDNTLTKRITELITEIYKDIRLNSYISESTVLEYNKLIKQEKQSR